MYQRFAVVMAGGQGTRFWPESTKKRPKQYLTLVGNSSLLKQSLKRFKQHIPAENRFIVTVDSQADLAKAESTGELNKSGIILEPAGRNTAPCILLSIASLLNAGASLDDVVTIVPADHIILNESAFGDIISLANERAAKEDVIVTIGIPANFPHTGYGYIKRSAQPVENFYKVESFREKPDLATATEYLRSGDYLWNAGMFVVRIGHLLEEFKKYALDSFCHFDQLRSALADNSGLAEVYHLLVKESIDYAIMEKSASVEVIPATFDWNDLGSWDALESVIKESEYNTTVSAKHLYLNRAKGNIIFAPNKFVSLVNVDDLIVVATDDNVLVLPKKDAQRVKEIVTYLEEQAWGSEYL